MRRPTNAERLFNGNDLGPSWQPWVFFADTGSSGGGEQPGGGGGGSSGAGAENSGNGAFGEIGGSASREQQTGPGGNVEFSGGTGSLEASQAGNGSNGSNEPAFGSPDLVAAGPPASANIGPGPTGSNVAGVGLGNPGIGASGTIQGTTFAANSAVGQFFAGAARGVYDVVSSILGGLIPGFGQVFGYGVRAAAANSNQAYGLSPDLSVSGGYGTTGYGTGAQGEGGGGGFLLTAERLLFGSGGGGAPASVQPWHVEPIRVYTSHGPRGDSNPRKCRRRRWRRPWNWRGPGKRDDDPALLDSCAHRSGYYRRDHLVQLREEARRRAQGWRGLTPSRHGRIGRNEDETPRTVRRARRAGRVRRHVVRVVARPAGVGPGISPPVGPNEQRLPVHVLDHLLECGPARERDYAQLRHGLAGDYERHVVGRQCANHPCRKQHLYWHQYIQRHHEPGRHHDRDGELAHHQRGFAQQPACRQSRLASERDYDERGRATEYHKPFRGRPVYALALAHAPTDCARERDRGGNLFHRQCVRDRSRHHVSNHHRAARGETHRVDCLQLGTTHSTGGMRVPTVGYSISPGVPDQ